MTTLPATIRLTEQERKFVGFVSNGCKRIDCVVRAGYKTDDPEHLAAVLISQPNIQAAVVAAIANDLQTNAAPLALKRMKELLEAKDTPARVIEGLIKAAFDRGGHPAARPRRVDSGADKTLNEMSAEDLRRFIDQAEGELASRAKPVNSAKPGAPTDQASDIFD